MLVLDYDKEINRAIRSILADYDHNVSVEAKSKSFTVFGKNASVGNVTPTTIMELAGSEVLEAIQTTNSIDSIVCDDNSFTGAVKVEGYTINGTDLTPITQTIIAAGHAAVSLVTPLARITGMYNDSTQAIAPTGKVYGYRSAATAVVLGIPATAAAVHMIMNAEENRSLKCQTATSKDDFWIITEIYSGVLKKQTAAVDFRLQISTEGKVFQTAITFSSTSDAGMTVFTLNEPLIIPPNSDVRVTAVSSALNTSVFSGLIGPLATIIN